MNETIRKFGYPSTLVAELEHWVILLRPAQVTLGSLVLAAKSDATAFSQIPVEAFTEQADAVRRIEQVLAGFCSYERLNYLMLMMVDPNVHFHVIPRYSEPRQWNGLEFADAGWPGMPQLGTARELTGGEKSQLTSELAERFR
ncbi:HIT family protein [Sphingomonas hankyongi]|uniref:HIT family protein n=1 Tax=Sphingomonas hankyongi TaxID=2908209 RepID=A0ABT0S3V8_9SPHN|nr:HIT family protein [Sphingomonas hankyongi]